MLDIVRLLLRAGDGGHGRVSFRREKYVPKGGPDGGDGGDGGNIIFRAVTGKATLEHLAGVKELVAQAGKPGGKRKMFGEKGEDLVVEVPVGTTIWVLAETATASKRRRTLGVHKTLTRADLRHRVYQVEKEGQPAPAPDPDELTSVVPSIDVNELSSVTLKNLNVRSLEAVELVALNEPNQEAIVAQGGFGGNGNEHFKSSARTTPLLAEYGTPGEKLLVILELKMLADVGLVGYPNAGKSTLLSVLTQARPKIGAYPFTTLNPQLGVVQTSAGNEYVMADIPGLIEGASEGKGLGYDFLRHIEHCRVLMYLLSLDEAIVYDEARTDQDKAELVWQQYHSLRQELVEYAPELQERPFLLVVNKIDVYPSELIEAIRNVFKKHKETVTFISAATKQGLPELGSTLEKIISSR